ncbi:hypothetical protein Droror1_Dr00014951 [Drosera rotundifolia]
MVLTSAALSIHSSPSFRPSPLFSLLSPPFSVLTSHFSLLRVTRVSPTRRHRRLAPIHYSTHLPHKSPEKPQPPPTHLAPSSLLSFMISDVFYRIESESFQDDFLFFGVSSVSLDKVLDFDRTRAHLFGPVEEVFRIEAVQTWSYLVSLKLFFERREGIWRTPSTPANPLPLL